MQVNLHFVMLEESANTLPITAASDSVVARITIIRECKPGELDFDDLASDTDLLT